VGQIWGWAPLVGGFQKRRKVGPTKIKKKKYGSNREKVKKCKKWLTLPKEHGAWGAEEGGRHMARTTLSPKKKRHWDGAKLKNEARYKLTTFGIFAGPTGTSLGKKTTFKKTLN